MLNRIIYPPVKNDNNVNDYVVDDKILHHFTDIILQDEPLFLARIGGSDFDAANLIYNHKSAESMLPVVKNFNGYFDFDNQSENYEKYLKLLIDTSYRAKYLMFSKSAFYREMDAQNGEYYNLLNYISEGKIIFHYFIIEAVLPFLTTFKIWGKDKKILIVSPMSESIKYQFRRKNQLIKNYNFPDFILLTYTSNVTYNETGDTKETLNITSRNWHEECQKMANDISKLDFDIAFLSCGSYAMFLGDYIQNTLHKKAIYIGGVLNVLFNIYGGRYDTGYYNSLVNLETQIAAIENDSIKNVGGRTHRSESINAYFGKK